MPEDESLSRAQKPDVPSALQALQADLGVVDQVRRLEGRRRRVLEVLVGEMVHHQRRAKEPGPDQGFVRGCMTLEVSTILSAVVLWGDGMS